MLQWLRAWLMRLITGVDAREPGTPAVYARCAECGRHMMVDSGMLCRRCRWVDSLYL